MTANLSRFIALIAALAAALLTTPLAAQDLIVTPESPRPRLVIAAPGEQPVRLSALRIRGEVSGRLALTEIEMTFHNPNRRILEGELQFPLLDGQSIASFAMDVNGVLREAVPVEKTRGQAVFEDITRVRVDPGLLERTQGNNFKLRVYPIPANGIKRVVVRVSEALIAQKGLLRYRIPLDYADRLPEFALDLQVNAASDAPHVSTAAFGDAKFTRSGSSFSTRIARADFAMHGFLDLDIPVSSAPGAVTQFFDGKTYFYAEAPLASREAPRTVPERVGIVWDSSGSGASRDHARELGLLDAYFKAMKNGEVQLTRIRNTAEAVQVFRIRDGDWHALRDALAATAYDGATALGAFVPKTGVREYLVFSDGLGNFGDAPFPVTSVPVYTVNAATSADTLLLRHIAQRSAGRFIDLKTETSTAAARMLLSAATRVARIDTDGATQVVTDSPYGESGRIAIAGVLTEPAATLRLTVEHPGAKAAAIEIPVRAGDGTSSLAASQWARLRLAELDAEYDLNRGEIRRLGQAFGLVTRETSLIVLDRAEDYARFEIAPPAELRTEYERLMQLAMQRRKSDRESHIEQVVRMFTDKVAWWNRDFPKDDVPRISEGKVAGAEADRRIVQSQSGLLNSQSLQLREQPRREIAATDAIAPAAAPAMAAPPAPSGFAANRPAEPAQGAARAKKADDRSAETSVTIQLRKWQPDAPYVERLRSASASDIYRIYLDEKPGYTNSTAFFLDAADLFFEKGLNDLAVRVLSNLAEMNLENRHILRILGYRLVQSGNAKLAIPVFRKVLALSPEEPQSYRDLGLAYAEDKQAQKAVDMLSEVVVRPWHGRFPEIELIALAELNAIAATAQERPDLSRVDPRLVKNLSLDLRAVLTWDADNTDIDLWVTDPNGEKAFYGHRLTRQGGRMSLDFTGGYGPEEFSLKQAKPGKYRIEANYFGDNRQNVTGPTTLQVKLTTKFGLAQQRDRIVTLRLKDRRETVFVGEFEVK